VVLDAPKGDVKENAPPHIITDEEDMIMRMRG
jgi:hypothetical protein